MLDYIDMLHQLNSTSPLKMLLRSFLRVLFMFRMIQA